MFMSVYLSSLFSSVQKNRVVNSLFFFFFFFLVREEVGDESNLIVLDVHVVLSDPVLE